MTQSSKPIKPLKIIQVLPALNAGGVERGTLEFARELVKLGHQSLVISSGGRLVAQLEAEGSRHITRPVQRKSLMSLRQVRPLRQLLTQLDADIIHVRSRMPAWLVWLAWRKMPAASRPGLVSTFHGLYSVNRYSAIMAKAQRIIAISDCVHDYVVRHYGVKPAQLTTIHRGLDPQAFHPQTATPDWQAALLAQYPQLRGKTIILMPGRLSRWKGQAAFLHMMAKLAALRPDCHGVIVGDAEPGKQPYLDELLQLRQHLGLDQQVTFLGHRADMPQLYDWASIVCHMSNKAEPFGRTLTEALASGTPVVAFDRGGASESLKAGFPAGLVPPDDLEAFAQRILALLAQAPAIHLPASFYLDHQVTATLAVYQSLLEQSR